MFKLREKFVSIPKKALAKLGYRVVKISSFAPVKLFSFDGDPRSLRYLNRTLFFLIIGKIKDGRSLLLFPLGDDAAHPFVKAVKEAIGCSLSGGDEREAIRSNLLEFYSSYQPKCAAEVLGVAGKDIPMLDCQPPWVVIKPWENLTVEERRSIISRGEVKDNSRVSLFNEVGIDHGCNFCGPVSKIKLGIEVERLYAIMKSIGRNGYRRHDFADGDIRVDVLVHPSGDWRWFVKSGQHRVAVLSALGFKEIPIRVEAIVCRDEVDVWPHVLAGNYSRKMALRVFDNIFFGIGAPSNQESDVHRKSAFG
jgi:hypothetical protein